MRYKIVLLLTSVDHTLSPKALLFVCSSLPCCWNLLSPFILGVPFGFLKIWRQNNCFPWFQPMKTKNLLSSLQFFINVLILGYFDYVQSHPRVGVSEFNLQGDIFQYQKNTSPWTDFSICLSALNLKTQIAERSLNDTLSLMHIKYNYYMIIFIPFFIYIFK